MAYANVNIFCRIFSEYMSDMEMFTEQIDSFLDERKVKYWIVIIEITSLNKHQEYLYNNIYLNIIYISCSSIASKLRLLLLQLSLILPLVHLQNDSHSHSTWLLFLLPQML